MFFLSRRRNLGRALRPIPASPSWVSAARGDAAAHRRGGTHPEEGQYQKKEEKPHINPLQVNYKLNLSLLQRDLPSSKAAHRSRARFSVTNSVAEKIIPNWVAKGCCTFQATRESFVCEDMSENLLTTNKNFGGFQVHQPLALKDTEFEGNYCGN